MCHCAGELLLLLGVHCVSVSWGGDRGAGEQVGGQPLAQDGRAALEKAPQRSVTLDPQHKMEVLHAIVHLLVLPFVLIVRMGVACRLGRGLLLFLVPGLLTLEAAASQDRELQLSWLRCFV